MAWSSRRSLVLLLLVAGLPVFRADNALSSGEQIFASFDSNEARWQELAQFVATELAAVARTEAQFARLLNMRDELTLVRSLLDAGERKSSNTSGMRQVIAATLANTDRLKAVYANEEASPPSSGSRRLIVSRASVEESFHILDRYYGFEGEEGVEVNPGETLFHLYVRAFAQTRYPVLGGLAERILLTQYQSSVLNLAQEYFSGEYRPATLDGNVDIDAVQGEDVATARARLIDKIFDLAEHIRVSLPVTGVDDSGRALSHGVRLWAGGNEIQGLLRDLNVGAWEHLPDLFFDELNNRIIPHPGVDLSDAGLTTYFARAKAQFDPTPADLASVRRIVGVVISDPELSVARLNSLRSLSEMAGSSDPEKRIDLCNKALQGARQRWAAHDLN